MKKVLNVSSGYWYDRCLSDMIDDTDKFIQRMDKFIMECMDNGVESDDVEDLHVQVKDLTELLHIFMKNIEHIAR